MTAPERVCPLGDDCDLTAAYLAGAHSRDDQIRALAAEKQAVERERDNALNNLDSVQHDVFVLERRCGEFMSRAEAAEARAARMEEAISAIAPWLAASLSDVEDGGLGDSAGPEYRAACEKVFAVDPALTDTREGETR